MMIGSTQFNCELGDVVTELQTQLALNGIMLLRKIRNTPKDIMIQCPYHGDGQERKPSAGLRKSDGQFHCFACGEVHSLQEVISHCFGHYEDVAGTFGWKWLCKNFASIEVEERKDVELDFYRRGGNTFSSADCLGDDRGQKEHTKIVGRDGKSDASTGQTFVSEEELDRYRYTHPYWTKRGITDERLIELFDLGYDRATDCITFPVRDASGRCLFVARRSVKTKYFNYPAGVEKPLYGLYEYLTDVQKSVDELRCKRHAKSYFLTVANEVIVCESMLDALTAWEYGKYAVALNGLGNERQFRELRELPCRKLILATDNDSAGMKARKKIRDKVKNKIITEYVFPEGRKDLNELSLSEFRALEEVF